MSIRDKLTAVLDGERKWPDAAETADAIIAALPDMIEPLVWGIAHDNGARGLCIVAYAKPYMGRYNIEWWPEKVLLMVAGGEWVEYSTKDEAKAAAEAHHRSQILSAFGVTL